MHDLIIENVCIVDGTGADRFQGSVAVKDGRVVSIQRGIGRLRDAQVDEICVIPMFPLSNDRKAVREYCLPDHLGKHHKWVETDVPVGLNE